MSYKKTIQPYLTAFIWQSRIRSIINAQFYTLVRKLFHAFLSYEENVTNRIIVVLPTPGGPINNKEAPSLIKSCNNIALPEIALPARQVRPIIVPLRFLIALIRCSVLLIPARLSTAKSPTCEISHSWIDSYK